MSADIKSRTTQYNNDVSGVNDAIQAFNQRAANNGFSSQSEFNSQRAALMARVDTVNQEQSSINSEIDAYNQILQQYNQSVLATKQLYGSINSLSPAPTVK
jgi:predicted  nucleic acid-binding Zn-ribbon protein